MMMFLVLLRTDNDRGSCVVACTALRPDPLFSSNVILENIQALSWPFHGRFLGVHQWSVNKETVINWMVGPLKEAPTMTAEMLKGEDQEIPWPPLTTPSRDLGEREVIQTLVGTEQAQEPTPEPQEDASPPPPAPIEAPEAPEALEPPEAPEAPEVPELPAAPEPQVRTHPPHPLLQSITILGR